jgi:hypothetical protein
VIHAYVVIAERHAEMRFADAGRTEEYHVGGFMHETQASGCLS